MPEQTTPLEASYRRTIELPIAVANILNERAAAKGITLAALIRDILERSANATKEAK